MMKSLGADRVIDYTKENFTKNEEKYEVSFDTVGKSSFWSAIKSLNKKGHLLLANAGISTIKGEAVTSIFINKKLCPGK